MHKVYSSYGTNLDKIHRNHEQTASYNLPNAMLSCGCPISLSPVLKPVADLYRSETSAPSQLPFLRGVRVGISKVPLSQESPGSLFEAVRLLLSIPNRLREGKLLSHTVFVHWAETTSSQLLSLNE